MKNTITVNGKDYEEVIINKNKAGENYHDVLVETNRPINTGCNKQNSRSWSVKFGQVEQFANSYPSMKILKVFTYIYN